MANISKFNMDGKNINVVDTEARAKAEQATGNIEKVTEDLQAETERAQNAETANTTLIQNETSRAEGAESSINNKLEEETSRAKEAEQANAEGVESNAGKIADETTRAENAESNLQTSITNETTRAEQEERTNRNNINDLRENKVDNVSVTNENGIYTLTQTKNGNQTEIGTINTNGSGSSNNPVVEVKDSFVEDNDNGYDYHTLSETTEDGTENNIGHLYVAQNQITGIKKSPTGLTVSHIDQSGNKSSEDIEISSGGGGSFINIEKNTVMAEFNSNIELDSLEETEILLQPNSPIPSNSLITNIYMIRVQNKDYVKNCKISLYDYYNDKTIYDFGCFFINISSKSINLSSGEYEVNIEYITFN